MGMFAETAFVDNRFIVCQPKKTNFRFTFSFAANKHKFAVSVCSEQMEVAVFC
jgi:hypothetical protein